MLSVLSVLSVLTSGSPAYQKGIDMAMEKKGHDSRHYNDMEYHFSMIYNSKVSKSFRIDICE